MAILLPLSEESLSTCANALLNGELVAFPTETVFGLGANALNEMAVEKIFTAKGRPKSDPLIVHLHSIHQAKILTEMSLFQRQCFDVIGNAFWPGPLTIIVKSSNIIPKTVTAGGDSVALRIPSEPAALKLLKKVNLPIAAPSANRFGHVSPTSAQHVLKDLGNVKDLYILDHSSVCDIGIESTIIKISENNIISLLRPGAISSLQINQVLLENNIHVHIEIMKRKLVQSDQMDSPGQLLTHYSPSIESFIIDDNSNPDFKIEDFDKKLLQYCVIVDYKGKNINLKNRCLCYFDISPSGNFKEAAKNLFHYLREAEEVEGAKYILFANTFSWHDEEMMAVFDRIYRAASGKFIQLN